MTNVSWEMMMLYNCRIKNKICFSAVILLIAALLPACSYQGDVINDKMIRMDGQASVHEVSNEKLRTYMHKLNTIVFEPYYSELERDKYRLRYSSKIAEVVNELINELEQDPALKLGLNKQEQQSFLGLVEELKQQTQALNILVSDYQSSEIKTKLEQMTDVCNRCHQQFRSR